MALKRDRVPTLFHINPLDTGSGWQVIDTVRDNERDGLSLDDDAGLMSDP